MRAVVVAAGLLGAVGVIGLASARIPPASPAPPTPVAAVNAPSAAAPHVEAPTAVLTQELRRMRKHKAKPKGAVGARLALPKACAGGKPNTAAKPYC
jgi:hypothetical protein